MFLKRVLIICNLAERKVWVPLLLQHSLRNEIKSCFTVYLFESLQGEHAC